MILETYGALKCANCGKIFLDEGKFRLLLAKYRTIIKEGKNIPCPKCGSDKTTVYRFSDNGPAIFKLKKDKWERSSDEEFDKNENL